MAVGVVQRAVAITVAVEDLRGQLAWWHTNVGEVPPEGWTHCAARLRSDVVTLLMPRGEAEKHIRNPQFAAIFVGDLVGLNADRVSKKEEPIRGLSYVRVLPGAGAAEMLRDEADRRWWSIEVARRLKLNATAVRDFHGCEDQYEP